MADLPESGCASHSTPAATGRKKAWGLEPIEGDEALSDLAYAAMVQQRTAVAAIIGGADEALARRRLRAALRALVGGTFRAKPGAKVTARSVRRAIATLTD